MTKPSKTLPVHWLKEKTMLFAQCVINLRVKVTASGQYDVMKCCQSDAHLHAVTKHMQHVPMDQHMRQQQMRADSTQQVTAAELMFCKFVACKQQLS